MQVMFLQATYRDSVLCALALNDGEAADGLPLCMLVEPIHRVVSPAAAHRETAMIRFRGRERDMQESRSRPQVRQVVRANNGAARSVILPLCLNADSPPASFA